jgi:hypothetical protein
MKTQGNLRLITRCTGVALLVVIGLGGTGRLAGAFECPAPHPTATQSAIKQTEPEILEYSNLLAKQGTGVVPEIIAQLKKRHPRFSDAEITNFLVTIYCPVVNQNGDLGDDQKRARIMAFSLDVAKRLERP